MSVKIEDLIKEVTAPLIEEAAEKAVCKYVAQNNNRIYLIPFETALLELGGISKNTMYRLEKEHGIKPIHIMSKRNYLPQDIDKIKSH